MKKKPAKPARKLSAAKTARFSGLFFVAFGAGLALFLSSQLLSASNDALVATVASSTEESGADENNEPGTNGTTGGGESGSEPPFDEANISVVAPDEINGEQLIKVFVPGAESVKLFLRHLQSNTNHFLGHADLVSNVEWRYPFNSLEFENGEYRLGVLVVAPSGTHDIDHGHVSIFNEEDAVDEETDTETSEEDVNTAGEEESNNQNSDNEEEQGTTNEDENATAGTENEEEDASEVDESDEVDEAETEEPIQTEEEPQPEPEPDPETDVVAADEEAAEEAFEPSFDITVRDDATLSGVETIGVSVENVLFIEAYVIPRFADEERYVGLVRHIENDRWRLVFNTTNTPNGEYRLLLRGKTRFGFHQSDPIDITIANQIAAQPTIEQVEVLETVIEALPEIKEIEADLNTDVEEDLPVAPSEVSEVEITVQNLVEDAGDSLEDAVKRLAVSVRSGDQEAIKEARNNLRDVKEDIKADASVSDKAIEDTLDDTIADLEARTVRNVEIIEARASNKDVFNDSDNDGISDYDEVHLYETDPFVADSDGDGFVDGAEVLSGFDPKDDAPEALVAFESPKDTGIVREDILIVEDIVAAPPAPGADSKDEPETAIIRGTALPNSFVTLYVFSTPVIVTVKTDSEGAWSYTFDKELEDGTHEVYVGITDNAGKIVAKSNPLTFVKEAEAFTPVAATNSVEPITQSAPLESGDSLLSEYMALIILSVIVVLIGLILILLGVYYGRQEELSEKPA